MYRLLVFLGLAMSLASLNVHAERGFYLGAGAGISDLNTSSELRGLCDEFGVSCTSSESDTQIKGLFGYRFNDYLALEGTIYDIGEPALSASVPIPVTATVELSGGSISVLPHLPLGDRSSLFVKLGLTAAEATGTATAPTLGQTVSDSTSSAALILGIGGQFGIGSNFLLRLEWERYSFDEVLELAGRSIDTPEIDVLSAAVIYSFGR